MRYRGRLIAGGDVLFVRSGCRWVRWIVSDFSPATGCIYGRRKRGPYERLPAGASWVKLPPPPKRLTPEQIKAERARQRAERKAHLAARDQCVRDIRERDRAAGIVCISGGSYTDYWEFDRARGRRRY